MIWLVGHLTRGTVGRAHERPSREVAHARQGDPSLVRSDEALAPSDDLQKQAGRGLSA